MMAQDMDGLLGMLLARLDALEFEARSQETDKVMPEIPEVAPLYLGGDGGADSATVTVVVGVEQVGSDIVVRTQDLVVSKTASTVSSATLLTLSNKEVVTLVTYSETTHTLYQDLETVVVLGSASATTKDILTSEGCAVESGTPLTVDGVVRLPLNDGTWVDVTVTDNNWSKA